MTKTEKFLTSSEEEAIIEAIRIAERNTSGEIRVHLESSSDLPPLERAKEVFYWLKMNETLEKNAVLFYVAVEKKEFAIIGDDGINKKVPNSFWNDVKKTVIKNFKIKNHKKGLVDGILMTGDKLKTFFPYHLHKDTNELNDEISKS